MKEKSPVLFTPYQLRGITLRNRICISPMCTYSADADGKATDWHLVHLGQYALGGAGVVFVEVTAIEKDGRTTYGDLGLWSDDQIEPLARIASFLRDQGAIPAIQLGHAGRKASAQRPWHGMSYLSEADSIRREVPWPTVSSTSEPVDEGWHTPQSLSIEHLKSLVNAWRMAARRAKQAGFDIIEAHFAHGYLMHQFLSPLINKRTDEYGGDLSNRMRFPLQVAAAVRDEWPEDLPMFTRISAVDGQKDGWELLDSLTLARALKAIGVDVIDCSSGGISGSATARGLPRGFGFQVPFAERIRQEVDIATMAVGLITDAMQAEQILAAGRADLVAIGREALYSPYWTHHAARELQTDAESFHMWPEAYGWWLTRRQTTLDRLTANTASSAS